MEPTRLKKAISCKHITDFKLDRERITHYIPVPGDVAVFKVEKIGKHIAIQGDSLRNITILPGDYILAAFGHRYATEQFEGYVPTTCQRHFHILGMGGAIGIVKSTHVSLEKIGPTELRIVGYAVDENDMVINTKYYNEDPTFFTGALPKNNTVILSVGSSMDSGKTTTAGYVSRGLKALGKKVAYIKLTGTVFTKDKDFVYDCGADVALDFSDFGFPSTYMCDQKEILDLYQGLMNKLKIFQPDFTIIEIADGLYQRETHFLLNDSKFLQTVDGVIFSSGDSLSAVHGVQLLRGFGITPLALSGVFTMSPLLIEEVKANCNVPVYTIGQLMSEEHADILFSSLLKAV